MAPMDILYINEYWCSIRHVRQPAHMRIQLFEKRVHHCPRLTNSYIFKSEINARIKIGDNSIIGTNNLLYTNIDKIVERVQVLLHQPPYLQEFRKKAVLIHHRLDGCRKLLLINEFFATILLLIFARETHLKKFDN
uniref:Uncharacterized protein MANES_04G155900 n=1 Tax=Rhizophora mucronata TaxID=61149 RepID=A0A2P2MNC7_RHIMU